ncbi:lysozyme [Erwinia endophytica]|uniref:lysozyme n=1 Tax=Erwinia endophytica TaxID=1563158 RepID=UPI001265F5C7|nr:glycoside hydrolase family protein [Erwinia endophytica]KAB8310134.1 lysozyme [Erwinia endophytica]
MAGVNDSLSFSTAGYGQLRIREGVVYRYYNDLGPHSGNCTWGVGTLAHFGVCTDAELKKPVTASDINTALARHVHKVERYIRRKVPHHRLTQTQFDGLVSFIYNVSDPSAVMDAADRGDMKAVHDKMLQYIYIFKHDAKGRKVGNPKILAPLYKRRLEEAAPFRQE